MNRIRFEPNTCRVAWGGRTVGLLPKEYALLEFMDRHSGQILSREQLLNAVWPMESPVDRTVDDHVYRLRKKLALWGPAVQIKTIRGTGYQMIAGSAGRTANPLRLLPSFSNEIKELAGTFLRYGRGDALLALFRNKEAFGFDMEHSMQLFMRFMEGDLRFVVEEGPLPFTERAFLLLYLYQHLNPRENRRYVETALRRKMLPPFWQNELENIIMVSVLMDWEEFGKAKAKLDWLSQEIESNNWEGLMPYAANLKVEYKLRTRNWGDLDACLIQAETLLARYPYLREEGRFMILKGIARYGDNPQQGLASIDGGLALLEQSQFLPHLIDGYCTVIALSNLYGWEELHDRFAKEWDRLSRRIGLDEIKDRIAQQLFKHLGSL